VEQPAKLSEMQKSLGAVLAKANDAASLAIHREPVAAE